MTVRPVRNTEGAPLAPVRDVLLRVSNGVKRVKSAAAVTLVEVMVAIVVIAVAVIGAMG